MIDMLANHWDSFRKNVSFGTGCYQKNLSLVSSWASMNKGLRQQVIDSLTYHASSCHELGSIGCGSLPCPGLTDNQKYKRL